MPHRPPPPLVSNQLWLDTFLAGARELLASSSTPPPHSPPHVEEDRAEPPQPPQPPQPPSCRVLRTRPRSHRRRRQYEPLATRHSPDPDAPMDGAVMMPPGEEFTVVEGRLGLSYLTGKALHLVKDFSSEIFKIPPGIPTNTPVDIWGRSWIVQTSLLGADVGLGLFALEDIVVRPKPWR